MNTNKRKTAYINGIILDGTRDMIPVEGKVIVVDEDIIESIVDLDGTGLDKYNVVDLKGKYILPGLINLHVHLPGSGKPSKRPMNLQRITKLITSCEAARKVGCKMGLNNAQNALMAGVTTLRTVGGISNFDTRVRDEIDSGKCIGPRIVSADCAITVQGGHMGGSFAYMASSVDDAVSLVDKVAKGKPDFIKIMVTGGVMDTDKRGEPGVQMMDDEYIEAVCNRAHELGYKVAAHCEGRSGVLASLKYGVDVIEHGAHPDDEVIQLFKEKCASQVVTISPAIPYCMSLKGVMNLNDASVHNSKVVIDGMVELAKQNLASGNKVGLGTDSSCSYVTHYDFWRELKYFTKYCDVSNNFALHTATLINAQIAGVDNVTGSIEAGKSADMIVVEKNPIDDLEALRNVQMVIFRGKLYDSPKVKKIAEVDDILDTLL